MSYSLIALDLDGTVLRDDLTISPRVRQTLDLAAAKGLRVTLASGRGYPSMRRWVGELGVTAPIISYQGAEVTDPLTHQCLRRRTFPLLLVEDEGRLHDPELRENFIERIFVYKRWREMINRGKTMRNLVDFHTMHKLLIMSHSPLINRELGKIVADGKSCDHEKLFSTYLKLLNKAMVLKTTAKKNANVLQHIMGYFKKDISHDEKQELIEIIDAYRNAYIPLIVPITLLNHYVKKYNQHYLSQQYYLNPHPLELKLRTHV